MIVTATRGGARQYTDLSEVLDLLHPDYNADADGGITTLTRKVDELTNIVSQMVELQPRIVQRQVMGPLLDRAHLHFAETRI